MPKRLVTRSASALLVVSDCQESGERRVGLAKFYFWDEGGSLPPPSNYPARIFLILCAKRLFIAISATYGFVEADFAGGNRASTGREVDN